jgi:hypothetical protein
LLEDPIRCHLKCAEGLGPRIDLSSPPRDKPQREKTVSVSELWGFNDFKVAKETWNSLITYKLPP